MKKTGIDRLKLSVAVAAIAISLGLSISPIGRAWDTVVLDLFFLLRGPLPQPKEIVLVVVDEPSFGVLKKQWPWPRSLHATLIENLFRGGARVVVFDMIFAEPSSPQEDSSFREMLRRCPATILASDINRVEDAHYVQEIVVGPAPELIPAETETGFINLPVDPDGFIRRARIWGEQGKSLAFLAALRYCGNQCPSYMNAFAAALQKEYHINFLGPSRTLKTISYYQALEPASHLPANIFKDKIVFVGISTQSAEEAGSRRPDHFPVPFSRFGHGFMAGAEIHGHIAQNLLHNSFIRKPPGLLATGIALLAGIVAIVVFFRVKPSAGAGILALVLTGTALASYILFVSCLFFFPVVYVWSTAGTAYMAGLCIHYLEIWKEKNFIRKAFTSYVAPSVVNQLITNPERLSLGGEAVEATVLFSDIVGFTSLSEKVAPYMLVELLNRYLGAFTDIVFSWEGTIDKYIGDAVMAIWGVPIAQADHAKRACFAALAMKKAMTELAVKEAEQSGIRLQARIGVNSGTMVAGNVGARRYFNYTVLGNEVNLASRLEGINRLYGTDIIIGQHTAELVKGSFELRELDIVRVKGKREAVRIYELLEENGSLDAQAGQVNEYFTMGRLLYQSGRWQDAKDYFEKGLLLSRDDGPCKTFLERCELFLRQPPEVTWDGVFEITNK